MADALTGVTDGAAAIGAVGQVNSVGAARGRRSLAGDGGAADASATDVPADSGNADTFEPSSRLLNAVAVAVELAELAELAQAARLTAGSAESDTPALARPLPADPATGGVPAVELLEPLLATPAPADAARAANTLRSAVEVAARAFQSPAQSVLHAVLEVATRAAAQPRLASSAGANGAAAVFDRAAGAARTPAHDALAIVGQAWSGQRLAVVIEPDERRSGPYRDESDAPAVWQARVRLELPRLGVVDIAVRAAGNAVAVELRGASHGRFDDEMHELASRLEARGLDPVSLAALAPLPLLAGPHE
jgi:hypothetical protein